MKKGRLIVISAPSGTGKSTVVRRLCERMPSLLHSVSCTTRVKRDGEKEGIHYHFISKTEFEKKIALNYFLEWAMVHGSFYGTPKTPIQENLAKGKSVIMDIDVQGGMQVKKNFPDALMIFLLPPSMPILERRLRQRGTDLEEEVKKRLENAQTELKYKDRYDHHLVNDDLEETVAALEKLLEEQLDSHS